MLQDADGQTPLHKALLQVLCIMNSVATGRVLVASVIPAQVLQLPEAFTVRYHIVIAIGPHGGCTDSSDCFSWRHELDG
jgi:hypothetical protein